MCIATPRKIDTVCQSSDLSCVITIYLWFVTILVGNDVSILFGGCYLLVVETTGNDSGRGCYQASSKQGTREATTASSEPWLMTCSSRFPKLVDSPERRHQRIPVVFGNSERSASCNMVQSLDVGYRCTSAREMPGNARNHLLSDWFSPTSPRPPNEWSCRPNSAWRQAPGAASWAMLAQDS
jgi:hypothetical protein